MEGVSSIKYDEDVFGWWGNRYNNNVALFIGDGRWSRHTVRGCSRSIGHSRTETVWYVQYLVRCTNASVTDASVSRIMKMLLELGLSILGGNSMLEGWSGHIVGGCSSRFGDWSQLFGR